MKKLLFLRHGKSDWDARFNADHDRPLAPRGIKAARSMGRFIKRGRLEPDLALSSSAVRARATVELAHEAGEWQCPIQIEAEIYSANPGSLLALIQKQDAALESILLAGHEPTFSLAVEHLIGGGSVRVPTATLAVVYLDRPSWSKIRFGDGTLQTLLTPKLVQRGLEK